MSSTVRPLRFAIGDSELGRFAIVVSAHGLAALLFGQTRVELNADLARRFPSMPDEDAAGLADIVRAAQALIERPQRSVALALDPQGSAFQHKVWTALRRIPAGRTASYAEVAREIGAPRAVRAVAQACGANPIAIAIPCHRVVRSDGSAGGYRWGAQRKAMLLAAEAAL